MLDTFEMTRLVPEPTNVPPLGASYQLMLLALPDKVPVSVTDPAPQRLIGDVVGGSGLITNTCPTVWGSLQRPHEIARK